MVGHWASLVKVRPHPVEPKPQRKPNNLKKAASGLVCKVKDQ